MYSIDIVSPCQLENGSVQLDMLFDHDVNIERLSLFAEKSILCQMMPVREMDLVHCLRKSRVIHVEIELD